MTFRSPLLQSYPTHEDPQRLEQMRRRGFWVSVLGFLIGIPTAMVWLRLPPKDGWGYWLYWLHDTLFLTVKGYSYTHFYPYSMLCWLLASLLLLFWLTFFLTNQSLLRPLHLFLLYHLLAVDFMRGPMLASVRYLTRFRILPGLLEVVADHRRTCLLDRLIATPNSTETARELATITLFQLELLALPGGGDDSHAVRAALAFEEVFLPLRASLGGEGRQLLSLLARQLRALAPKLNACQGLPALQALDPDEQCFSPTAFCLDLLYLACLGDAAVAKSLPHSPRTDLPVADLEHLAARRLAETSNLRRAALDQLRFSLEGRHLHFRHGTGSGFSGPLSQPEASELGLWGRLGLGLAVDCAWLDREPGGALTYFDSIEALRLALALPSVESEPEQGGHHRILHPLLGRLPLRRHYRQCSQLAKTVLDQRKTLWKQSHLDRDGYLLASDFDMEQDRIWDLTQAHGPDMSPGEDE